MPSRNLQNTHIDARLRELHGAVLDIVAAMNRPQQDEVLIRAAGIPLDRALFPLLVGVGKFGPIGVVELADRAGRDHTTVSRQVARLEAMELVRREEHPADRRVRLIAIAPKGKAMTAMIDKARARLGRAIFRTWNTRDIDALVRLMRRFADDLNAAPPAGK